MGGFFKGLNPDRSISRWRLAGLRGSVDITEVTTSIVYRGEVIDHIDMSLEKVDTQTKVDQSHAVAKAEEKKLI